ncbi:thymidine phosphorylase [Mariniblastus sp.]|jgi:pyrimidine-nucleoside phosphorylase|nr:thymidine phosphorylase [Mariniblastus sp.]MDB4671795.1 thymidine phosphorylase [Pirellulaceae bacterium]MDB4755750.1 thymidine phosphorylase [Mariniblastus sp.]
MEINCVHLIAKKRDGQELSANEIKTCIEAYAVGDVPDYQMSALAMAIVLNGMSLPETIELTRAMFHSGHQLEWTGSKPVVDKHSTGGIGDKISLTLAPLLASCDVRVPMISGRGLGPTGGTLDKLESIPCFRTNLSAEEIQSQVNSIGCVITGATGEIAPADRRLYALRNVTGTVKSIPLVTASILSKKLAAGLDALVLDVKFGSGAIMKNLEEATQLAESLVAVGGELGLRTHAILSDMSQTLGTAAGNANEVVEAIEVLQGRGPEDVVELTVELAFLLLRSVFQDAQDHFERSRLRRILTDGTAYQRFKEMVESQTGVHDFSCDSFMSGPMDQDLITIPVCTDRDGFLSQIDASQIGFAVNELGGGRMDLSGSIDFRVGVRQLKRIGDPVRQGDAIFSFTANKLVKGKSNREGVCGRLENAFLISPDSPMIPKLIRTVIDAGDRE